MNSPSDKVFFIENDARLGDLEKEFQAYQLLIRNDEYLKDVEAIRKKYSVGQYPVEGDAPVIDKELDPENEADRTRFYEDVRAIADKIQFPGDWEWAVREHVVGYDPADGLLPRTQKRIVATAHVDHIELKLFGDVTVQDVKDHWKEIKKLITASQVSSKTNYAVRKKPKLSNSLVIFDMAAQGVPPKQIAEYCDKHGIRSAMQDYEVSKYVELARKQIAKIYA